ncbi:MAG: manganese-dependent inorganic pyrophosphatase [Candidatus Woesebacteria bacterium]|jgi:manganese-dependent inorganic pyrophosphatase
MPTIYIIGHRKPDTDSVVSAMALEFLYKAKSCFGYKNPQAAIVDPLNPETKYLFEKFGIEAPKQITAADIKADDQVVLVDHNEESQRLEGLNPEQIVEIVDHHKVNLNLSKPIFMTFKTWGSSSAIIYFIMKQYSQDKVKPDKTLAALMLAAILSDTVGFKSATSTDKDKKFGHELAKIAEIDDLDAFTLEIFKAKSNVADLSDSELVKNDYKIFDFTKKTFIGQVETVEQVAILNKRKNSLLKAMEKIKAEEGVELLFLVITDVLKVNSKIIILGEEEKAVAKKAFGGRVEDNILDIGPKMSRKKEIAPVIEKTVKE